MTFTRSQADRKTSSVRYLTLKISIENTKGSCDLVDVR